MFSHGKKYCFEKNILRKKRKKRKTKENWKKFYTFQIFLNFFSLSFFLNSASKVHVNTVFSVVVFQIRPKEIENVLRSEFEYFILLLTPFSFLCFLPFAFPLAIYCLLVTASIHFIETFLCVSVPVPVLLCELYS